MQDRRVIAVAVALSLALGISGCVHQQQEAVTEADVTRWHEAADDLLPLASTVDIASGEVTCTPGRCYTVDVAVAFPTFAELVESQDELAALHTLISEERPGAALAIVTRAADSAQWEEQLVDAVLAASGGELAGARADLGAPRVDGRGLGIYAQLLLYVDNQQSVTPTLLEQAVNAASDQLPGGNAVVGPVRFMPVSADHLDFTDDGFDDAVIAVADLDSFASVAAGECVVQGDWAFDISRDFIRPYPVTAPEGACAP